jgi:hypothetical protein
MKVFDIRFIFQTYLSVMFASSLLLLSSAKVYAAEQDSPGYPQGDAALSHEQLRIPEPLLFDLVRPLGARKGELEVNVLGEFNVESDRFEWAPEIEYAFADGYAIELEFPTENGRVVDYKLALQGTLGMELEYGMIHGWQVIGLRNRKTGRYSADALYINGLRLSDKWSTLNMIGIRRTEFSGDGENKTLLNNNLFYDVSQRLTLGIELNHEINPRGAWRSRIVPQIHLDFSQHTTLQLGAGISRINESGTTEKVLALRFIHAF